MNTRKLLAAGVIAAVIGVSAWARRDAAAPSDGTLRFEVTGVIVAPVDNGTMTVAHEDIKGYMPAMTMPFVLEKEQDAARLAPGDRVVFTLVVGQERSRAENPVVTGHDPTFEARTAKAPRASARLRNGDAVPPMNLIDQDGKEMTSADWRGHATVVTFIFTRCPMPEFCPLISAKFKRLQDETAADARLKESVRLVSITLDPEHDTPAVLRDYALAKGADLARWRFGTGTPEQVAAFTRAFAVHTEQNGPLLDHTLATALVGSDGRVVEVWRGNQWEPREVLDALRAGNGS
jgi:protein SCO1/2